MENSLSQQITDTELPDSLKTSLSRFSADLEGLKPAWTNRQRGRISFFFKHLIDEVSDPETEVHWWELTLDLAVVWADNAATASAEAKQAIHESAALLRQELDSFFGPYSPVELVEINEDTVSGILLLSDTLREPQRSMVADNSTSLSQAHFNKYAWFRAVHAGKAPVGFLMLFDNPEDSEYFLWRFMIAAPYQGRGYGRQAIELLVEYVRSRPQAVELGVSCGQGDGSPEEFYKRLGFVPTGEIEDDEVVLSLKL